MRGYTLPDLCAVVLQQYEISRNGHIPYQCNHQQQGYFRRDDESRQRASDLPVPLREELRRGVIRRRSGRERAEHPLPDPSLLGKGGAATENDFKPKQNNETIPIFIDLRGCGDGRLYGGAARFRHDARGAACAGGAVRRPDHPAGDRHPPASASQNAGITGVRKKHFYHQGNVYLAHFLLQPNTFHKYCTH